MASREEIRSDLIDFLDGLENAYTDEDNRPRSHVERLLEILHSQGVVIKVERAWLPNTIDAKTGYVKTPADMANDMLKAGYVAVEPLIGEK